MPQPRSRDGSDVDDEVRGRLPGAMPMTGVEPVSVTS
jgi:hypothetical protein